MAKRQLNCLAQATDTESEYQWPDINVVVMPSAMPSFITAWDCGTSLAGN